MPIGIFWGNTTINRASSTVVKATNNHKSLGRRRCYNIIVEGMGGHFRGSIVVLFRSSIRSLLVSGTPGSGVVQQKKDHLSSAKHWLSNRSIVGQHMIASADRSKVLTQSPSNEPAISSATHK